MEDKKRTEGVLFNFHFFLFFFSFLTKLLIFFSQIAFVVFNLHLPLSNFIVIYFLFIFFNICKTIKVMYLYFIIFVFKLSFSFFFGLIVLYICWIYNFLIFFKLSFINDVNCNVEEDNKVYCLGDINKNNCGYNIIYWEL